MSWKNDVQRILIAKEDVQKRVAELGAQLTKDYQGKNLLVLGILKGAVIFYSDLVRSIDLPLQMDFIGISSYGAGTKSTGAVKFLKDTDQPIEGLDVLVVEDIVDTGLTLNYLLENLSARKPASLKTCCLLDKPQRREVVIEADYVGFKIPNEFVVGYGLDYNGLYRNIPDIGVLSPRAYGDIAQDIE
ncbi:MAG: hypoxanthine phosphoribosyltransferase [Christensenellales bacterium]